MICFNCLTFASCFLSATAREQSSDWQVERTCDIINMRLQNEEKRERQYDNDDAKKASLAQRFPNH